MFQWERGQRKPRCPLEREFFLVRPARGIPSSGRRDRNPQSNRAEMGISAQQGGRAKLLLSPARREPRPPEPEPRPPDLNRPHWPASSRPAFATGFQPVAGVWPF